MNESIQHQQRRSQRSDSPIGETPLVHLDNVRQVQPDMLPTQKGTNSNDFDRVFGLVRTEIAATHSDQPQWKNQVAPRPVPLVFLGLGTQPALVPPTEESPNVERVGGG
jgi:hypothetical protein